MIVATSLVAQTACFAYLPAPTSGIRAGTEVQLDLSGEGSIDLEPLLGPRVRSVAVQVQEVRGDSVAVVLIDEVVTADGDVLPWRRGRVSIPVRDVASVRVRTLDRRRTWTLVGVVSAVFTAVIITALRKAGSSGSTSRGPGSGPPE